jgi:hypothetical protein
VFAGIREGVEIEPRNTEVMNDVLAGF